MTRPFFTRVEFGRDGKHFLLGNKTEGSATEQIHSICTFMEECLKEWLEHIELQRSQFYYLNHYTTEQLVILQNELPKIAQKMNISKNVYPLLEKVKKNCSKSDLEMAFKELADIEANAVECKSVEINSEMEEDDLQSSILADQNKQLENFWQKMEECSYSKELAIRALKEKGADNVEEGNVCFVDWC